MGHGRVGNLSKLFVKQIYAKGKISIDEAVKFAQKKGEVLGASEGDYSDEYMLAHGIEMSVRHLHSCEHCGHVKFIEPIFTTKEQEDMYKLWMKDTLSSQFNYTEVDTAQEIFDSIQWKFTKGSRKLYLENKIDHMDYFTN